MIKLLRKLFKKKDSKIAHAEGYNDGNNYPEVQGDNTKENHSDAVGYYAKNGIVANTVMNKLPTICGTPRSGLINDLCDYYDNGYCFNDNDCPLKKDTEEQENNSSNN